MTAPNETEIQWLTPEDLARIFQVTIGTVANWRTNKKGPKFKRIASGSVRYHPADVTAWLDAQPNK